MKHLIVGYGEVGKGLKAILDSTVHDPFQDIIFVGECEVMHICIPYADNFISIVEGYKEQFKPKITIIHSTVPVGTCKQLGAVHSPIRGIHPHLENGIRTFTKYFGGKDAKKAAKYFEEIGIETFVTEDVNSIEAGKLWSTTQYGFFIMLNKEIKKWCVEHDVDFDLAYTHFNETYNKGYSELGMDHVIRPVLKYMIGPIGGHCILQNASLLDSEEKNDILELVKKR